MHRFNPVLQWLLVATVVLMAFIALQPSPSAASAYPSTLKNYDAPTAWSSGCQWSQICHGNVCYVGTDPNIGCKDGLPHCTGCAM